MYYKMVEFKILYDCFFKCSFCVVGEKRDVIDSLSPNKILYKLDEILNNNPIETIHLSGGEPTMYKELESLLLGIKKRNIKNIILHTNAVRFSNEEFSSKILPLVDNIFISFHAINDETHKSLCGVVGGVKHQINGIENCLKQNKNILINTVMTQENIKELNDISDYIINNDFSGWMLSFPYIQGWVKRDVNGIVPGTYQDLMKSILPVLNKQMSSGKCVVTQGMPVCYLENFADAISDNYLHIKEHGFDWNNRLILDANSFEQEESMFDVINLYKKKSCKRCKYDFFCSGFWKELLDTQNWPKYRVIN